MKELEKAARSVQARAHVPYSGFKVGAALQANDGSVFVGCNVENASYGLTTCAERVAIGTAVSAGYKSFDRIVVVTDVDPPSAPCGACRQVLVEFGPDMEVVAIGPGETRSWTMGELLPAQFGRKDLNK
jgi:cytidine deaminase